MLLKNFGNLSRLIIVFSVSFLFFPLLPALLPAQVSVQENSSPPEDAKTSSDVIYREQTIYVPYEKLRSVFETEGRGVFLPYDEFRKLWDATRANSEIPPKPKPEKSPVVAMITETENIAKINGDLVEVTASIKYDLLEPGWHQLPLRLQKTAIIEAKIGEKPAQILGNSEEGYKLLVGHKDEEPVRGELTLKFAKSIEKSPGRNSVSFDVPQAPLSRWEFHASDSGVKVDFVPMIAASEIPVEQGGTETVFQAFAGPAPTVQIAWTPKSEGATGLEALANVQSLQRMIIEEGVTRNSIRLNYTVSRAQLDQLAVEVPEGQKIIGVIDDNVRSWNIVQGEKSQIIQVELFEPTKSKQSLTIELEKFIPVTDSLVIDVPRVKVVGVGGHQGILGIDVVSGLACEPKKVSGLIQIDPSELPQTLKIGENGFAYRLTAPTYDLELAVEKEKPRIFAKSQVSAQLDSQHISMDVLSRYRVEKAGVFQLLYDIPADFTITNISIQPSGSRENKTTSTVIEGHQLSDVPQTEGKPAMKRLTVNLSRKALGEFDLRIMLNFPLKHPELSGPTEKTEKSVELKIVPPTVATEGVVQKEGIFIITARNDFRITPTGMIGMQGIPFDQIGDKWISPPVEGNFAYVFAQEQPELSLQFMRRTPQVTIKQVLASRIEDGVAKFTDKIYYDVLYSGVKSIRIDVPKSIARQLRNQTKEIRDTVLVPQPEDMAEEYEAWSFASDSELSGNGIITLTWEEQLPQLLDGKSVEIGIPRLIPQDVFRSWGQILLTKAETVDLSSSDTNEGLRQIDPQHDIDARDRLSDAAYAFAFHNDWKLSLLATRYELQEVKRASIECGVIRAVLTRANTISVQAIYRIQSVKQRLPITIPEGSKFDVEPKINGMSVTLETDATGRYLIPLTSTVPNKPFLLELRYTQKKSGNSGERKKFSEQETLTIPVFPDEPAVQHVYLAVYVPEEYALTAHRGAYSKNFEPSPSPSTNRVDVDNTPSIDSLIYNVQQGTSQLISSLVDFPVDGTPYLFSAIQPDPAKGTLLKIKILKLSIANTLCFLIILGIAIGLVRCSWRIRGFTVFLLLAAFSVFALFAPTFAAIVAVLTGTSWAIMLGLLLWVFWSLLKSWDWLKRKWKNRKTVSQAEGGDNV